MRYIKSLKPYLTLFRIRFLGGLQYRAAALAGISTQFFWGAMKLLLYRAFYRSDPGAFPMTLSEMSSYIWIQQAFFALFTVWSMETEPFELIKSGNIAYELCRPADIYGMWFSRAAATKLSKSFLRCIPILAAATFVPAPYGLIFPGAERLGIFAVSMALTLCEVVSFTMLIYISTFYTLDSIGVRSLLSAVSEFLSGGILPLPFFPEKLQKVILLLPFAGMENTPLQIFNGALSGKELAAPLMLQVFWTLVMTAAGKLMMKSALRRTVAQGG